MNTLFDSGVWQDACGEITHEAGGTPTQLGLTATYTGPSPIDAAPIPNYRLQINITNLRVWATDYSGDEANALQWQEVTPENFGVTGPLVNLIPSWPSWHLPANFVDVAWNPPDFQQAGLTGIRSFNIIPNNTSDNPALDGLEIFANVELIYDVVPEPASIGLLAFGGVILLRRRTVG